MFCIASLSALEILDSRGRPTVKATCALRDGAAGAASVPSGASTGSSEALELRDGDPKRHAGLGCLQAVANVNRTIHHALQGASYGSQEDFDRAVLQLDGTPNKSRLGANAILAVSLAFARACAASREVPLYQHFADLIGAPLRSLPRPTINLFSGGKHAGGQAAIQDILVVPNAAQNMSEALADTCAVYHAAAQLILSKYGMRLLRADEGGLAPPFQQVEDMLSDAVEAISLAQLTPGRDMMLAVDIASTQFYREGKYFLTQAPLDSAGMIAQLTTWVAKYPIVSVEDGLAEEDWAHWPQLEASLSGKARVVGDDFLCTNPARIARAAAGKCANTLLLKVNQIGSLSEAMTACQLARAHGWQVTVSARSGETEDDWLADLAVGWSADQIKVGSITQSERLAKYNRLLEIEAATGLPIVRWPNP